MFDNFMIEEYWPFLFLAFGLILFVGMYLLFMPVSKPQDDETKYGIQYAREYDGKICTFKHKQHMGTGFFFYLVDGLGEQLILYLPPAHPSYRFARNLVPDQRVKLVLNKDGAKWGSPDDLPLDDGVRYMKLVPA